MKKDIHPKYQEVTVKCVCGNEFKTRSTRNEISLSLCNACHPFFTGKQKFVDTAGRIEKFQKRFNLQEGAGTAVVIKEQRKVTKRQVQAAAIQEEKRLKAARRAPKRVDGPVEAKDEGKTGDEAAPAPAPEA